MELEAIRAALARSGIQLSDDELRTLKPHVDQYLVKLTELLAIACDEDEPAIAFVGDRDVLE